METFEKANMLRYQKPNEYLKDLIGVDPAELAAGRMPDGTIVEGKEFRFDCTQKSTDLAITIRCMPKSEFRDVSVERLLGDSARLASVNCETFLKPVDWGVTKDVVFVAHPRSSGWPLNDILRLGQSPSSRVKRALSITRGALTAIQKIHEANCIARNICLSNLFMGHDRVCLVCPGPENFRDFGIVSEKKALDYANFASPELAGSIQFEIGPASDLYSIGVLLFTLVTGREPFQGDSVGTVLYQHITVDPQILLSDYEVPRPLVEVIGRLLKKDPRARYQSAHAVLNDLQQIQMLVNDGQSIDGFVIGREDTRNSIVEPSFVGRTSELTLIEEQITAAANGAGQSLAVIGLSGMGKSRLINEASHSAVRRRFSIYRSIASNHAREIPTTPLLRIIEQLKEQIRTYHSVRNRLSKELLGARQEIALVFPELAESLGWPSVTRMTREDLTRSQVENAFVKVLACLGDQESPALVWIDDCHYLDPQSRAIIAALLQQSLKYCLFVFSLRNDDGINHNFSSRIKTTQQIFLSELGREEMMSMLESMAGHLPELAAETVVKLAAGSPFMAAAVLHGLIENEALTFESQTWKVDKKKLAGIQASQNAADALVNRLHEIPPTVQKILSAAAIIGKEFDEDLVSQLCRLPVTDIQECMKWSRQQRIVWAMANGKYLFVHDKIKDAILARMSPSFRKESHLAYAQFLEKEEPENDSELAYHYHLADEDQRALPFALKATAQAQRLQSLERAEELLRIALNGLQSADKLTQHEVHSKLANVLMLSGKYDESAAWLEKSLETAESSMELANIEMKLGELAFKRGDKEMAVDKFVAALKKLGFSVPTSRFSLWRKLGYEVCVQALHSLFSFCFVNRRRGTPPESKTLVWRLHGRIAHGYWYTRDKFHTLWAHLRHMNMAEIYGPTVELAQAYSEHAPGMSLIPWHSRGIKYVKRSLKMREQMEDNWGQGQSRNFYSILLYSSSQYAACVEQASLAESILVRAGDPWEVNIARYQNAASLYRLGDLKAALDLARRTYDSALSIGDHQSTSNIIDVWVRASLGEIPEEVLLTEAVRAIHDTQSQCQTLLAYGIHLLFKQEFDEAIEKFQTAIDLSKKSGIVNAFVTPNYPWLVTAMRKQLEIRPPRSPAKLRQLQNRLLRAAKRAVTKTKAFPNDLPHALREMGIASSMLGHYRNAKSALIQSISIAEKQKAVYEKAQSQEIYGSIGSELGWPNAEKILQDGVQSLNDIRKNVTNSDVTESMSMLDRFDSLLMAGRQIISVNAPNEILLQTIAAAKRLLRGQRTIIIERKKSVDGAFWHSSDTNTVFDLSIVEEAVYKQRTIVRDFERYDEVDAIARRHGTYLCSPITVHGEVAACLYVANEFLSGLFGENEIRIADYVTTTAGSALEKSDGFRRLEELNVGLEKIVHERTATVEARSVELERTARELMATQSKLEQARDEAETANASKSEFLARMSHEIRTPISAIMGFTELMLRGIVNDPLQRTQKLETIYGNSTHLLQLINDLLDLSKIEAEKMQVEAIDCNPLRLLYEVVSSLNVRAEQKSISLNMKFDGEVPQRITSDPTRLRQVLINVIGNAIKFTSVGGVDVTMRVVEGPFRVNNNIDSSQVLEFEVVDSGIGMTAEQQAKIFDPFSQADSTVTRKFGGTGLGLSISKQLAEALGGGVTVSSVVNVGSAFTIRINPGPLRVDDMLTPEEALESVSSVSERRFLKADLSGLRVLIVDDGETNRELLKLMLSDAGAKVECRSNGQEGVDAINSGLECDVVLMDMQMPVLDGYSASRLLRQQGFGTPIIALTANTMVGDEEKCRACGCSDYLSKPIDINSLLQKLSQLFGLKTKTLSLSECFERGQERDAVSTKELNQQLTMSRKSTAPWEEELPDDEVFRSFAIDFVEEVDGQMGELHRLVENRDYTQLACKAHWIKGTGGTVGLPTLTTIASDLEKATKVRDLEMMTQAFDRLCAFIGHERKSTGLPHGSQLD